MSESQTENETGSEPLRRARMGLGTVLISDVVRDQAGVSADEGITLTPLGERDIRGREGTISVYRLDAAESSS
ncbi:MAG: hypothetical protein CL566_01625 [Alphaproteobacteria bacterium]|nr:hypothetical protein [Alphaproteobacteria bacterium]|tara:strand:+ start:1578 stop:1796 length:219 start_codon:yes stop_codon:yes gene_type:complete